MNAIITATDPELTVLEPLPLDQNPAAVYLAGLPSPNSQRNLRRYLNQIAHLLKSDSDAFSIQWGNMRYQHTKAILARLSSENAPDSDKPYATRTVNGMLSALRGVLKEAWRLGQMSAEEYQRAVDFKNLKIETLAAGRDLSSGEIMALVNLCLSLDSAAGIRDATLIGVLYTAGLRRSEVVHLTLADYTPETGQLKIIGGKGNKSRTVYVTNGAQEALQDWLVLRGDTPGALFTPINKGGRIILKPMSAQAIYNLLEKRAAQAQVKDFTPHDFRRTFAGEMLDGGVDIATIAKIMGHASIDTTGRYDRRPETVKRAAAQKIHFPYTRRRLMD
ncbi:MAG: site-specific integrase [Chloroflexota bacterium]